MYLRKVLQTQQISGHAIYLYQMMFGQLILVMKSMRIPGEQGLQVNLLQLITQDLIDISLPGHMMKLDK